MSWRDVDGFRICQANGCGEMAQAGVILLDWDALCIEVQLCARHAREFAGYAEMPPQTKRRAIVETRS